LYSNRLYWPINKTVRSLQIYVIEPGNYKQYNDHAAIFNAAIERLANGPGASKLNSLNESPKVNSARIFDLATFPEAFLPSDNFVEALSAISHFPEMGCIHVGLRPKVDTETHLFEIREILALIEKILEIPELEKADLDSFKEWINIQPPDSRFNLGCLFKLDAEQKLRVCLHPKIIRSKFEIRMRHESNMTEADLLTVVTLVPQNKRFISINLQPLLCADGLIGDVDHPDSRPLYAINNENANCFKDDSPDHIDIVSLATCTPHPHYGNSSEYQWHPYFQDSFYRSAHDEDLSKHHHAIFVLSNFRMIDKKTAGLSGAFIPVPLREDDLIPPFIFSSIWGNPPSLAPNWYKIADDRKDWSTKGYIASLRHSDDENSARMLGFTINKLPRQSSTWSPRAGLTNFQIFSASQQENGAVIKFNSEKTQ